MDWREERNERARRVASAGGGSAVSVACFDLSGTVYCLSFRTRGSSLARITASSSLQGHLNDDDKYDKEEVEEETCLLPLIN